MKLQPKVYLTLTLSQAEVTLSALDEHMKRNQGCFIYSEARDAARELSKKLDAEYDRVLESRQGVR